MFPDEGVISHAAVHFFFFRLSEETDEDGNRQVKDDAPTGAVNRPRIGAPWQSEFKCKRDCDGNDSAEQTGNNTLAR